MHPTPLNRNTLQFTDIAAAVHAGLVGFRAIPGVSVAYAGVFVGIGLVLMAALVMLGVSPLALPVAGGFMLVGPVLLTGYFELAKLASRGESPRLRDALAAFTRAPAGLWMITALCALLFLIWITDAGVLFSFTIGGRQPPVDPTWLLAPDRSVVTFLFWGSLMGAALAYLIFAVSAFAVPLIYERRAEALQAVQTSVQAVLGDFLVCLSWGLALGTTIGLSVLLLPLLPVTLPVMSYASFALYRRAFPPLEQSGT